jgi:hypothetical protein
MAWAGWSGALMVVWRIVGGVVFDYRMQRAALLRKRHPYARRYRTHPGVQLVIMAQRQDALEETLRSLKCNTYRKVHVLVVGYGLSHKHAAIQRQMVRAGDVGKYYHCKEDTRETAYKRALQRYVREELALVVQAGVMLKAETIRQGVRHSQDYPQATALRPYISVRLSYRLEGVLAWYREAFRMGSHKADAAFGTMIGREERALFYRTASTPAMAAYDPTVMLERTAPSLWELASEECRRHMARWRAAVQLLRNQGNPHRFLLLGRAVLFGCNTIAAICVPFIVGYSLYLALRLAQPLLLCILAGSFSAVLLLAVLEVPGVAWWRRCLLAMGIPLTYSAVLLAPLTIYVACILAPVRIIRSVVVQSRQWERMQTIYAQK